ncbi:MAG: metallophosphoesterase [Nanoarchaeota archaeon]
MTKQKPKKLRILAVGDIHGDKRMSSRLAEQAKKEKVDFVILTGDLTMMESGTEGLLYPFVKNKQKVLLIPGNHETMATANFLADFYPDVKNIHGYSIKTENAGIFGAGGANIGIFKIKEDEIFSVLEKGFLNVKDKEKKIMVTHVHPSGTLMENFSKHVQGSYGVRKAIEKFQPDIALCSHVHEASGIEERIGKTRLINVSKNGVVIEI